MKCPDGMLKLNFDFGKLCCTARFFSFCKGVLMANSTVLLFRHLNVWPSFPRFHFYPHRILQSQPFLCCSNFFFDAREKKNGWFIEKWNCNPEPSSFFEKEFENNFLPFPRKKQGSIEEEQVVMDGGCLFADERTNQASDRRLFPPWIIN